MLQPDIPHIDEHVSKVECIGVKTQQKLLDIKGAAAAVGIQDLNVIHNSITRGGLELDATRNPITTGGQSTAARNTSVSSTTPPHRFECATCIRKGRSGLAEQPLSLPLMATQGLYLCLCALAEEGLTRSAESLQHTMGTCCRVVCLAFDWQYNPSSG